MTISFPIQVSFDCTSNFSASAESPTTIQPFKAISTDSDFSGVSVGDIVFLVDDPTKYTTVVSVDGEFELTISDDIIKTTDDAFGVLTASTAFKIIQDGTDYDFVSLFKAGDLVDTDDTDEVEATNSGCRIVSVDSPTQLTVSLPMAGYSSASILRSGTSSVVSVDDIDFFFYNSFNQSVFMGPYYTEFSNGGLTLVSLAGESALKDVEDAIVKAVSFGYTTNAQVNTRAFGAVQSTFESS